MIPIARFARLLSREVRDFFLFYYRSVILAGAAAGCFRHLTYDKVAQHRCRAGFFEQGGTVAAKLRAERNAPDRTVGYSGGQYKTDLRRRVGIEFRHREEEGFARVAIGTPDGDTDLLVCATHLDVLTFDDTGLSGTNRHTFTTGCGFGILCILCTNHRKQLWAADRFLYLDVDLGIASA